MSMTQEGMVAALGDWRPSFLPRAESLAKHLKLVSASPERLAVELRLGYPADRSSAHISGLLEAELRKRLAGDGAIEANADVDVDVKWKVAAHSVQRQLTVSPNARNVIAVGSGKGGVGKSTVAVNLAAAIAAEGARVGLLDADIYGPSLPRMLGVNRPPELEDDKTLLPLAAHGMQVMSVGFLVEEEKPVIWRGPMASGALKQLFADCAWDNLDYLVIDLPPGTGDVQLTLSQSIPVTGALIVSTPQDIAVADARKSVRMFEKVGVPVLGLVENMAYFACPGCGERSEIFGSEGVDKLGRDLGIDVLGSIPLDPATRRGGDAGQPEVVANADGAAAGAFFALAHKLLVAIAARPLDYSRKFGRIEVSSAPAGGQTGA